MPWREPACARRFRRRRLETRRTLDGAVVPAAALLAAAAWAPAALGAEIHVPRDHPTIQAAIDASQPGDVILVAPGVYRDDDAGDLRLRPGSPCLDAGDDQLVPTGVETDLSGRSRFADGDGEGGSQVDIGAHERPSPGDANGDGAVDVIDLLLLLGAWGACANPCETSPCDAEFDGDCAVSVLDLLLLLASFDTG